MADRSIIIIGTGLAGLSTGCYAQTNGYRSRIFEHHSKPGGVAAAWRRGDYLIDGGIHFLMGHKPGQACFDLYRELGVARTELLPDMTTYLRFVDEVSGRSVDITSDFERLARDLRALSPSDGQVIGELVTGVHALRGSETFGMMADAPELLGLLTRLQRFMALRPVWKYLSGKYAKPIAEYAQSVQDPLLQKILVNLFLPEVPVWFVFMVLALVADKQIGLLEGGCSEFVSPIVERYKALGGEVTYKATVVEILVENNRAVGVQLADGSQHRADVVVSAADGYSTIFKMLGGRYVDEKIKERYRSWELVRPAAMVSFGVAREFLDDPPLSIVLLKDPLILGGQAVGAFSLRLFNYSAKFAPPGKTVVQVMFESEWDFWHDLQEERPRYEAEKERVAMEVLARLEAHYPGLSSQVEVTDVATPYTTWRYTLNHRGAYMGWLPTPKVLMTQLPKALPGLSSFCMAGQWATSGGGVPPCLYSGRHVVQLLCHRDGKRFQASSP